MVSILTVPFLLSLLFWFFEIKITLVCVCACVTLQQLCSFSKCIILQFRLKCVYVEGRMLSEKCVQLAAHMQPRIAMMSPNTES